MKIRKDFIFFFKSEKTQFRNDILVKCVLQRTWLDVIYNWLGILIGFVFVQLPEVIYCVFYFQVIPRIIPLLPIWTVAAVVINGILLMVIFVWVCYKCECSKCK